MAVKKIQELLGLMQKNLECSICLELLKNPVATKCEHYFCRFCLTEFLDTKRSVPCPLCKQPITRRSLNERRELSSIVDGVSNLILAFQQDSGTEYTPPRGPPSFYPSTPETLATKPESHTISARKNVRRSKRTSRLKVEEARSASNEPDPASFDDIFPLPSTTGKSQSRNHYPKAKTSEKEAVRCRIRDSSRTKRTASEPSSDSFTEGLLQCLDNGSCGFQNDNWNEEAPSGPTDCHTPLHIELPGQIQDSPLKRKLPHGRRKYRPGYANEEQKVSVFEEKQDEVVDAGPRSEDRGSAQTVVERNNKNLGLKTHTDKENLIEGVNVRSLRKRKGEAPKPCLSHSPQTCAEKSILSREETSRPVITRTYSRLARTRRSSVKKVQDWVASLPAEKHQLWNKEREFEEQELTCSDMLNKTMGNLEQISVTKRNENMETVSSKIRTIDGLETGHPPDLESGDATEQNDVSILPKDSGPEHDVSEFMLTPNVRKKPIFQRKNAESHECLESVDIQRENSPLSDPYLFVVGDTPVAEGKKRGHSQSKEKKRKLPFLKQQCLNKREEKLVGFSDVSFSELCAYENLFDGESFCKAKNANRTSSSFAKSCSNYGELPAAVWNKDVTFIEAQAKIRTILSVSKAKAGSKSVSKNKTQNTSDTALGDTAALNKHKTQNTSDTALGDTAALNKHKTQNTSDTALGDTAALNKHKTQNTSDTALGDTAALNKKTRKKKVIKENNIQADRMREEQTLELASWIGQAEDHEFLFSTQDAEASIDSLNEGEGSREEPTDGDDGCPGIITLHAEENSSDGFCLVRPLTEERPVRSSAAEGATCVEGSMISPCGQKVREPVKESPAGEASYCLSCVPQTEESADDCSGPPDQIFVPMDELSQKANWKQRPSEIDSGEISHQCRSLAESNKQNVTTVDLEKELVLDMLTRTELSKFVLIKQVKAKENDGSDITGRDIVTATLSDDDVTGQDIMTATLSNDVTGQDAIAAAQNDCDGVAEQDIATATLSGGDVTRQDIAVVATKSDHDCVPELDVVATLSDGAIRGQDALIVRGNHGATIREKGVTLDTEENDIAVAMEAGAVAVEKTKSNAAGVRGLVDSTVLGSEDSDTGSHLKDKVCINSEEDGSSSVTDDLDIEPGENEFEAADLSLQPEEFQQKVSSGLFHTPAGGLKPSDTQNDHEMECIVNSDNVKSCDIQHDQGTAISMKYNDMENCSETTERMKSATAKPCNIHHGPKTSTDAQNNPDTSTFQHGPKTSTDAQNNPDSSAFQHSPKTSSDAQNNPDTSAFQHSPKTSTDAQNNPDTSAFQHSPKTSSDAQNNPDTSTFQHGPKTSSDAQNNPDTSTFQHSPKTSTDAQNNSDTSAFQHSPKTSTDAQNNPDTSGIVKHDTRTKGSKQPCNIHIAADAGEDRQDSGLSMDCNSQKMTGNINNEVDGMPSRSAKNHVNIIEGTKISHAVESMSRELAKEKTSEQTKQSQLQVARQEVALVDSAVTLVPESLDLEEASSTACSLGDVIKEVHKENANCQSSVQSSSAEETGHILEDKLGSLDASHIAQSQVISPAENGLGQSSLSTVTPSHSFLLADSDVTDSAITSGQPGPLSSASATVTPSQSILQPKPGSPKSTTSTLDLTASQLDSVVTESDVGTASQSILQSNFVDVTSSKVLPSQSILQSNFVDVTSSKVMPSQSILQTNSVDLESANVTHGQSVLQTSFVDVESASVPPSQSFVATNSVSPGLTSASSNECLILPLAACAESLKECTTYCKGREAVAKLTAATTVGQVDGKAEKASVSHLPAPDETQQNTENKQQGFHGSSLSLHQIAESAEKEMDRDIIHSSSFIDQVDFDEDFHAELFDKIEDNRQVLLAQDTQVIPSAQDQPFLTLSAQVVEDSLPAETKVESQQVLSEAQNVSTCPHFLTQAVLTISSSKSPAKSVSKKSLAGSSLREGERNEKMLAGLMSFAQHQHVASETLPLHSGLLSPDLSTKVINSAPPCANDKDEDDMVVIVRRTKRKCFSLEGSPLSFETSPSGKRRQYFNRYNLSKKLVLINNNAANKSADNQLAEAGIENNCESETTLSGERNAGLEDEDCREDAESGEDVDSGIKVADVSVQKNIEDLENSNIKAADVEIDKSSVEYNAEVEKNIEDAENNNIEASDVEMDKNREDVQYSAEVEENIEDVENSMEASDNEIDKNSEDLQYSAQVEENIEDVENNNIEAVDEEIDKNSEDLEAVDEEIDKNSEDVQYSAEEAAKIAMGGSRDQHVGVQMENGKDFVKKGLSVHAVSLSRTCQSEILHEEKSECKIDDQHLYVSKNVITPSNQRKKTVRGLANVKNVGSGERTLDRAEKKYQMLNADQTVEADLSFVQTAQSSFAKHGQEHRLSSKQPGLLINADPSSNSVLHNEAEAGQSSGSSDRVMRSVSSEDKHVSTTRTTIVLHPQSDVMVSPSTEDATIPPPDFDLEFEDEEKDLEDLAGHVQHVPKQNSDMLTKENLNSANEKEFSATDQALPEQVMDQDADGSLQKCEQEFGGEAEDLPDVEMLDQSEGHNNQCITRQESIKEQASASSENSTRQESIKEQASASSENSTRQESIKEQASASSENSTRRESIKEQASASSENSTRQESIKEQASASSENSTRRESIKEQASASSENSTRQESIKEQASASSENSTRRESIKEQASASSENSTRQESIKERTSASSENSSESAEEIPVKKNKKAIICSDSDSDHNSGAESEGSFQLNFTSSSALSSQSEIPTTQERSKMETELERLRREIAEMEARLQGHSSASRPQGVSDSKDLQPSSHPSTMDRVDPHSAAHHKIADRIDLLSIAHRNRSDKKNRHSLSPGGKGSGVSHPSSHRNRSDKKNRHSLSPGGKDSGVSHPSSHHSRRRSLAFVDNSEDDVEEQSGKTNKPDRLHVRRRRWRISSDEEEEQVDEQKAGYLKQQLLDFYIPDAEADVTCDLVNSSSPGQGQHTTSDKRLSNRTEIEASDEDSSDLFLSPLSPSPPPPIKHSLARQRSNMHILSTSVTEASSLAGNSCVSKTHCALDFAVSTPCDIEMLPTGLGMGDSITDLHNYGSGNSESLKNIPDSQLPMSVNGPVKQKADLKRNSTERDTPLAISSIKRLFSSDILSVDFSDSPLPSPLSSRYPLLAAENNINSDPAEEDDHMPRWKRTQKGFISSGLDFERLSVLRRLAEQTECKVYSKFNDCVTHVIMKTDAGSRVCDRTLKYFQGIAGQCWVLSFDWVLSSQQAGHFVPEVDFEIQGDTVQGENHQGPELSRLSNSPLLTGFAFALVGVSPDMSKKELTQLLTLKGAVVMEDPWDLASHTAEHKLVLRCVDSDAQPPTPAEIELFSGQYKHFGLVTAAREWVLDSICTHRLQPLVDYVFNTCANVQLPF